MPRIIHFEINAEEPEKIIEFYKNAFGWTIEKWDGPMEYWLVMTGKGEGIDGGIAKAEGEERIINTIGVDDLDAYIKKSRRIRRHSRPQEGSSSGCGLACLFLRS